jgi:hypothetical protein
MTYALLLFWTALADSMTGTWKVTGEVSGNPVAPVCTVVQTGTALTGQCTSRGVPIKLTGKVDDSRVKWRYSVDYEGQTWTLTYTGKMQSPSEITGTIIVTEAGLSGSLTATKE